MLELLAFERYLELCVQILRRDRSGPETHESGEFCDRVRSHGGTPTSTLCKQLYFSGIAW